MNSGVNPKPHPAEPVENEALSSQALSIPIHDLEDTLKYGRPDIPVYPPDHKHAGSYNPEDVNKEHRHRYFSEVNRQQRKLDPENAPVEVRFQFNDSSFLPVTFPYQDENIDGRGVHQPTAELVSSFTKLVREFGCVSVELRSREHQKQFGKGSVIHLSRGEPKDGQNVLHVHLVTKSYQPDRARYANLDFSSFTNFNVFEKGKHPIELCREGNLDPEKLGLVVEEETLKPDLYGVLSAARESLRSFFDNPTIVHCSGQGEHENGKRLVLGGIPDTGGQDKVIEDSMAATRSNGIQGIVVHRGGPPHRIHGDIRTGLHVRSDGAICFVHDQSDEFKPKEKNFVKEDLEALSLDFFKKMRALDGVLDTEFMTENVIGLMGHYIDGSTIAKEIQELAWHRTGTMIRLTHYLHSHGTYKRETIRNEIQSELEQEGNLTGKDLREERDRRLSARFDELEIEVREDLETYIFHHKLGPFDTIVANSKEVALGFKKRSAFLIGEGILPRDRSLAQKALEQRFLEVDNVVYPGIPSIHRPPVERGVVKLDFARKAVRWCMMNECGPTAIRELAQEDIESAAIRLKRLLENSWTINEKSRPDSFAKNKIGILRSFAKFIEDEKAKTGMEPQVMLFINLGEEPADRVDLDFNQRQVKELHVALRKLGIREKVIFTSSFDLDEAVALNKNTDCFYSPALTEPFGITSAEALCTGTHTMVTSRVNAAIDYAENHEPAWYMTRDGRKVFCDENNDFEDIASDAIELRKKGELAILGFTGLSIIEAGRTGDERMMSADDIEHYGALMLANDYHWYLNDRERFYEEATGNASAASSQFSWQRSVDQLYELLHLHCQQGDDGKLMFNSRLFKEQRKSDNENAANPHT